VIRYAFLFLLALPACSAAPARTVIILKVDGLNADLLNRTMDQTDPQTGRSKLPWLSYIFRQHGTVLHNFYVRGISLSAPSWSMLDTGRHSVIRGNVEFDHYTGEVYDYLNFFPFYLQNARSREEDMPGVRVLDRAGIPLLIDHFDREERFQSFQLFQRLVRWPTLAHALKRRFSSHVLWTSFEAGDAPSLDESLLHETERDLIAHLARPGIRYLDLYTGEIDHSGHATNQAAALTRRLQDLDSLAGRLWTALEKATRPDGGLFVMVSDHGMNNDPLVFSQGFSLPDLLNSPQGGGHHVLTDRYQLSDYKLRGLNPLVHRVVTPSTSSFYLQGQADDYPTAWLDLDGNERASLHLRNSDLNELHILLLQLRRPNLPDNLRLAVQSTIRLIVTRNAVRWADVASELTAELDVLSHQIDARSQKVKVQKSTTPEDRRLAAELQQWKEERGDYSDYLSSLKRLLALADPVAQLSTPLRSLIPPHALGENNTLFQLRHYAVGLSPEGLSLDAEGHLDEARSFRRINYFELFSHQLVRNNPQPALNPNPIDFVARRLSDAATHQIDADATHAYWLSANEDNQLLVISGGDGRITLLPVSHLEENPDGRVSWTLEKWRPGLPLHLFEDPALAVPPQIDRSKWLSQYHSEEEWFRAVHRCLYSNGVIGITEQFSPVAENVPGRPGEPKLMVRYERRRRELVEPDLQIFASDHWNFNVRNFNPGGNHGSFLRISTHSVWMMAGKGIPVRTIDSPQDTLNFASTVLSLVGKTPPMPDRVVPLSGP
jgi:hypothetical protein